MNASDRIDFARVFLLTGHKNGAVRAAMGRSLGQLGQVRVLELDDLRGFPFRRGDLVIVDVRFASHDRLHQVQRYLRGARYIEVRAGLGGLLQQTIKRLCLS